MRRFALACIVAALLGTPTAAQDTSHPDTNPPGFQQWYQQLRNRQNGSCCGEADGYAAEVDHEASPEHEGSGHVVDPSAKEIWVNGWKVKDRQALSGDLTFHFTWDQMGQEKFGNPTNSAIVFLHVTNGQIDRTNPNWPDGVYCLVMLPPNG